MANRSPIPARSTSPEQSWTDRRDGLANLTIENELADIPLEDLAGALAIKTEDRLALPLIFDFSRTTRQTTYRRGEAIVELPSGRAPRDSCWVEIDPRMSLRRALDLYGEDLLAFEKVVRRITLEIIVLPIRQRQEQTLRVLIRRPAKAA